MVRVITLGDGKRVTLHQYMAAIRLAKANPDRTFDRSLCGWASATGRQIMAEFLDGVQDRINTHGKLLVRKDRHEPQTRLARRLPDLVRECRWCGAAFRPASASQRCCSPGCQHAYSN